MECSARSATQKRKDFHVLKIVVFLVVELLILEICFRLGLKSLRCLDFVDDAEFT